MNKDEYMYEYRPDTRRTSKVKLRFKNEIDDLQGFISVYGYNKDVQALINKQKGTFGLKNYSLYSDVLYLDVDEDDKLEQAISEKLKKNDIKFEHYFSGKKGGHFHVGIVPMECVGIHDIQYQFVKKFFHGADLSIYRTSGIIRIIGSRHKKNLGGYKKLIYEQDGSIIDLKTFKPKYVSNFPVFNTHIDLDDIESLQKTLDHMLFTAAVAPGRHDYCFRLAAICADLNLDKDETTNKLYAWNRHMCNPSISTNDIESTINSAFK